MGGRYEIASPIASLVDDENRLYDLESYDPPMQSNFRANVARLSRDRTFVIRAALAILAVSVLASWLVSAVPLFRQVAATESMVGLPPTTEGSSFIPVEGDRAALRTFLQDPANRAGMDSTTLRAALTDAGLYGELLLATLRHQSELLVSPAAIPAFFGALIWIGILFAFWNVSRPRLAMATGAFLVGMAGAALAFFVQMLQERTGGMTFVESDPPFSQFLHFVVGSGLREETIKLLVAFPFLWWTARHRSNAEALIVAGLVGLGFITQESLTDFSENFATATPWTRLLTANGLHVSLTGLVGWAVARCCARRGRGWEDALIYFLGVVLAHAFYEALFAMPLLEAYSSLSSIFIAVVAYRYFDLLRDHREISQASLRVSPLGIFVIGTTALAGFVLLGSAAVVPYHFALGIFFASIGSLIPLAFAYISRFRDL
jgi:RsiW-degrading membrane proteinase PrsW (M82 family)